MWRVDGNIYVAPVVADLEEITVLDVEVTSDTATCLERDSLYALMIFSKLKKKYLKPR